MYLRRILTIGLATTLLALGASCDIFGSSEDDDSNGPAFGQTLTISATVMQLNVTNGETSTWSNTGGDVIIAQDRAEQVILAVDDNGDNVITLELAAPPQGTLFSVQEVIAFGQLLFDISVDAVSDTEARLLEMEIITYPSAADFPNNTINSISHSIIPSDLITGTATWYRYVYADRPVVFSGTDNEGGRTVPIEVSLAAGWNVVKQDFVSGTGDTITVGSEAVASTARWYVE